MRTYRLAKQNYAVDLSGKGAELTGGRWNSKGISVIYTSQSRALCLAEIAVHVPVGIVPMNYYLTEIEIPDEIEFYSISEKNLPPYWNSFPHSQFTQEIGDGFIKTNQFLVLKVPSAVVQGDFNFLINPKHPDFGLIKVIQTEPFNFDKRLFK
jgi:RES domain-containing protein